MQATPGGKDDADCGESKQDGFEAGELQGGHSESSLVLLAYRIQTTEPESERASENAR